MCPENNWVRRITTTKRVDRRRVNDLRKRAWDAMQPNRNIDEKQDEMGRPLGMNGRKQTSKESKGGKTSRTQEKGKMWT